MADRLCLEHLRIHHGPRELVRDVGFTLERGEVLAMVGPSGAGKTLSARALLGLVDLDPGVQSASLQLDVAGASHRPYDAVLGGDARDRDRAFAIVRAQLVGLLPQEARGALDPLRRVGWQVRRAGGPATDPEAALRAAGLEDPARVLGLWPHELSGGMARRVTLAQCLARRVPFLVVDEPTTGLDAVGVQALCEELRHKVDSDGLGLLVITHDLRLLPGLADRVVFLDQGQVVETLDHPDLSLATSPLAQRLCRSLEQLSHRRSG